MKTWLPVTAVFLVGLVAGVVGLNELNSRSAAPSPKGEGWGEGASAERELATELRALRTEVAQLRQTPSPSTGEGRGEGAGVRPNSPSSTGEGPRTLAYWNQMNAIIAREASMRAAPPQLNAGNATSFVGNRSAAFEFAAREIRQLNSRGVDPAAVALARDLGGWYDAGITTSRQAESLLTTADADTRRGAAGQAWQSAEQSHRQACLELNARGEQVRQELSAKYGLAFPKLN